MTETSRQTCFAQKAALFALGLALLAAIGCGDGPAKPPVGPPADSLVLSPDTLVIQVGSQGSFRVTGFDSSGAVISGSFPITWTTDDTAGAVITLSGSRIRGVGEGTAKVYAQSGSARDSGVVRVGPAQSGWFLQPSAANGANLHGLFFQSNGRNGWVVGANGKILVTSDAGENWMAQTSGTSFNLNGVWFTTADEGWAVGNSGTVLLTTDRGAHWDEVDTGAGEILMDVFFADTSHGWVVGSAGVVLRTRDRGRTWERQHPTPSTLNGVAFADTSRGWAVGENGVILESADGGRNWLVVQPAITALGLEAVWQRTPTKAWAVGDQGVVARTVASPADTVWQLGNAGALNQLDGVHFVSDLVGFAVGTNGTAGAVLRTDDGGLTWTPQISNTQFRLNDVFFVDSNRGWAVGASGTVMHTGTGGNP